MPRQDINVDVIYGEVNMTSNLANKLIYPFSLLEGITGMNNDHFCYGEIIVPPGFESSNKQKNGIRIIVPYYPYFKELYIRLRLNNENDSAEYVLNKTNNSIWFPIFLESEGDVSKVRISEFHQYNENGVFHLIQRDGYYSLFSGDESDFIIKASLKQNEVFLLKAFAGNLYQFPTAGVGLIEYLHGNFENAGLATKLQHEFENDNMVIVNAYMNSITGDLHLEVKEKGEESTNEKIEKDGEV